MIVIGIDPATRTGWAYGRAGEMPIFGNSMTTRKADACNEAYTALVRAYLLGQTIAQKAWALRTDFSEPCVLVMEDSQGMTRGQASSARSHEIRGCILAGITSVIGAYHLTVLKLQPSSIKKWATGDGKAEKPDVREAIARRFGSVTAQEDEGDALACWWFAGTREFHEVQAFMLDKQAAKIERRVKKRAKKKAANTLAGWSDIIRRQ